MSSTCVSILGTSKPHEGVIYRRFSCLLSSICQAEDAGRYTCVATNELGQDRWTATLSVQTHPVFTELLGDVALKKGERLLLACGVNGIPTPHITWVFNNSILPGVDFKQSRRMYKFNLK